MDKENNILKGNLEKLIKTVFERDFNDLSFAQLGEIAEIILSCSECPITGCDGQGCCHITFENALKKEREAEEKEKMALDEAIALSRAAAANNAPYSCSNELLQIAEWLTELKQRREDDNNESTIK